VAAGEILPANNIQFPCTDAWQPLTKQTGARLEVIEGGWSVEDNDVEFMLNYGEPRSNDRGRTFKKNSSYDLGPSNVVGNGFHLHYCWFRNKVAGANGTVIFQGTCREAAK